jgi:hypothetical protein
MSSKTGEHTMKAQRIGLYMTAQGRDRLDQLCKKFDTAQGEFLERLMFGMTDEEIELVLFKGAAAFKQSRQAMTDHRRKARELADKLNPDALERLLKS